MDHTTQTQHMQQAVFLFVSLTHPKKERSFTSQISAGPLRIQNTGHRVAARDHHPYPDVPRWRKSLALMFEKGAKARIWCCFCLFFLGESSGFIVFCWIKTMI